MRAPARLRAALASTKGEAEPMPEPLIRPAAPAGGRRVGAVLPNDLFAEFRHYVALHGITGDQVIRDAIRKLVDER
jgi:hypothetical protein